MNFEDQASRRVEQSAARRENSTIRNSRIRPAAPRHSVSSAVKPTLTAGRGSWRLPIVSRPNWDWQDKAHVKHPGDWYQHAVIYQIAPWSFQDSDGDGKGDLPGIIDRLDYIGSLGIDAIWLTPIYPSPMDDLGYDVTGMRDIGDMFGSMDDFRRLLRLLHERRIKLILDMVWNHTSDQHPWFQESRSSRSNAKADWYVWADPAPNGGPPNNWLSVLTGRSGWKYDEQRGQYYFYNFFDSQPDLNWHNAGVRAAVLEIARFWLDQGIDGMRLDAVNFFCHDPSLADNPMRSETDGIPDGIDMDNAAARQVFRNSFCRPDTFNCLQSLRALVDCYPGVVLLGEVTLCEDSIALAAEFTSGTDRIHLAYHSGLLFKEAMTAARLRGTVNKVISHFGESGASWIVGNHDYGRMSSLWQGTHADDPESFRRMMAAILISLPGALCLWQGDELGLPEARIPEDIPEECIRDPFGRNQYPRLSGRDPSRTPMPWNDALGGCGFTDAAQSWLPIPASHLQLSVARQTRDPDSMLNLWRRLLHWRQSQPALMAGRAQVIELADPVFALLRTYHEHILLCVFNVSGAALTLDLSEYGDTCPVYSLDDDPARLHRLDRLELPAWAACWVDLACSDADSISSNR